MFYREPGMTVDYWRTVGGTLLLEYEIEKRGPHTQSRRADGIIVLGAESKIVSRCALPSLHAEQMEVVGKKSTYPSLDGQDVVVVQTKAHPAGLPLLGQALLSPHLIRMGWSPSSLKSVAVHTGGADPAITGLMERFGVDSFEVPPANHHVDPAYPHLGRPALDWIHRRLGGEMVLGVRIASELGHTLLRVEALLIHGRQANVVRFPTKQASLVDLIRGRRVTLIVTSRRGGMSTAGEAILGRELLLAADPASVDAVFLTEYFDESIAMAARSFPGVTPMAYLA
jgi:hypothetical protein